REAGRFPHLLRRGAEAQSQPLTHQGSDLRYPSRGNSGSADARDPLPRQGDRRTGAGKGARQDQALIPALRSAQRSGNRELEAVVVAELERPRAPRAIGRLVEQLDARCADALGGGIDRGGALDIDRDQHSLALDPIPSELAVVLIEDDANGAAGHDGAANLAFTLELVGHTEAQHL